MNDYYGTVCFGFQVIALSFYEILDSVINSDLATNFGTLKCLLTLMKTNGSRNCLEIKNVCN